VGIGIGEIISLYEGTRDSRTTPKELSPISGSLNPGIRGYPPLAHWNNPYQPDVPPIL
jgi:hypothetical protein